VLARELNARLGKVQAHAIIERDADERAPRGGLGKSEQIDQERCRPMAVVCGDRDVVEADRHRCAD
jgi:hypothetical protein